MAGLLGFDPGSALTDIKNKVSAPFNRYNNRNLLKQELIDAHNNKDFDYFAVIPFSRSGKELATETIKLYTDSMPHQPFVFGGEQHLVKEYYPGNTEPTVQVLGSRESDINVKGRLKAKHIKFATKDERTEFRRYATEMQKQMDLIRLNGWLCRFEFIGANKATWKRWGFIEKTNFEMKTMADIDYNLSLFIVGFNKPTDYIIAADAQGVPFSENKELIKKLAEQQAQLLQVPTTLPRSISDQLNDAISEISTAVTLVTGFVDTILNEVDSVKASIERAKGLVKNARNKCTQFQRRVGAISPEGNYNKAAGLGVAGAYKNASYLTAAQSNVYSIVALLAAMAASLAKIAATAPLARHRIQSGDTLQKIAIKFYNDQSKWNLIFDHNKLTTTILTVGNVIEIPRA